MGFPSCHWMWCDGGGGKATCQVTNVLRQPTRSSSAHPKQATFISTRSCHSLAGFGQQCNGGAQKEAGGDRPRLSALSPPASRQPHASRHVSSTSLTSGREPVVHGAHLDRRRSKYSADGGLCGGKRASTGLSECPRCCRQQPAACHIREAAEHAGRGKACAGRKVPERAVLATRRRADPGERVDLDERQVSRRQRARTHVGCGLRR